MSDTVTIARQAQEDVARRKEEAKRIAAYRGEHPLMKMSIGDWFYVSIRFVPALLAAILFIAALSLVCALPFIAIFLQLSR